MFTKPKKRMDSGLNFFSLVRVGMASLFVLFPSLCKPSLLPETQMGNEVISGNSMTFARRNEKVGNDTSILCATGCSKKLCEGSTKLCAGLDETRVIFAPKTEAVIGKVPEQSNSASYKDTDEYWWYLFGVLPLLMLSPLLIP